MLGASSQSGAEVGAKVVGLGVTVGVSEGTATNSAVGALVGITGPLVNVGVTVGVSGGVATGAGTIGTVGAKVVGLGVVGLGEIVGAKGSTPVGDGLCVGPTLQISEPWHQGPSLGSAIRSALGQLLPSNISMVLTLSLVFPAQVPMHWLNAAA